MTMMKLYRYLVLIGSVAAMAANLAKAADYDFDASHSNVDFKVRHLFSKVNGSFKDFEGSLSVDEKKPQAAQIKFTVKAASINTNNDKRDEHLRGTDFFDTQKYPTLSFESAKVIATGKNKYKLQGNLTIHGVTKPVTFDVEYLGKDKDPWGNIRAGYTASAKINRRDFGLTWNKTLESGSLLVGDEVEINLNLEAVEKKPAAATNKT